MAKRTRSGFTYLSWSCTMNLSEKVLHVTAKFLGEQFIDSVTIEKLLEGVDLTVSGPVEWQTTVFETKRGPVYVLELTKFPNNLNQIHDRLASLFPDDHTTYRPHITVPLELWERVNQGLSPEQAGLTWGKLELRVLGQLKAQW